MLGAALHRPELVKFGHLLGKSWNNITEEKKGIVKNFKIN